MHREWDIKYIKMWMVNVGTFNQVVALKQYWKSIYFVLLANVYDLAVSARRQEDRITIYSI